MTVGLGRGQATVNSGEVCSTCSSFDLRGDFCAFRKIVLRARGPGENVGSGGSVKGTLLLMSRLLGKSRPRHHAVGRLTCKLLPLLSHV